MKVDAVRGHTIYPALNRLQRVGLLRSTWQSAGERRRRCYELTDAGRRGLAGERKAWQDFTAAIGSVLNPTSPPRPAT